jgi:predicted ATPase
MFINKLGLKNFKCFKEVEVDFSKITLLTGENSSGKSSLIYGLLAPFQSEGFPLYLFPNGKYVNMGDFEEISFRRNKNNTIEINIDFNENKHHKTIIETAWVLDSVNKLPKLYHLKTKFFNINEVIQIDLKDNNYICNLYREENIKNFRSVKDLEVSDLDQIYLRYPDAEDSKDISIFCKKTLDFANWMDNFNLNPTLNFIGSHRLNPERTYYQKTKSSHQIFTSGEGFIDQILEWKEKKNESFHYLMLALKKLNLLYDIKPHKIGGGRFDLRVKVTQNSGWSSLTDVGFGISQLLPILVADLQMDSNSTMIIAQPEIHLHPSIQAKLGDYFVHEANESQMQYIIETHSEYLINRLRLCIVKGEIESEDVAVYYFENTAKEGSIAHRIEFSKHGQILNAPQGFFDTYMMDTMNIALNA